MKHDIPSHMKLYNEILAAIESLEYKENSQLPSERYSSNEYYVSRATVCMTSNRLSQDGYIYTARGNTSFVQPQAFRQPLSELYSFTDELENDNISIHSDLIGYQVIQLDHMLAQKLSYPIQSALHCLTRLRSAQNYPLMLETTYLPKGCFHQLNIELLKDKGSPYEYLKREYDFHVGRAIETFRPIMADRKGGELLQIPNPISCQLLERYSYEGDSIAEYTHSVIREDKYISRISLR